MWHCIIRWAVLLRCDTVWLGEQFFSDVTLYHQVSGSSHTPWAWKCRHSHPLKCWELLAPWHRVMLHTTWSLAVPLLEIQITRASCILMLDMWYFIDLQNCVLWCRMYGTSVICRIVKQFIAFQMSRQFSDVFKDRLSDSVFMTVLIAGHAVQTPYAKCIVCAYP
jgi:hypothetical protein